MVLKIQTGKNNSILRQKAEMVNEITPEIKKLISSMAETCKTADGIGLAAPQIGKSLRLFIVRVPIIDSDYLSKEFINPKIVQISEEKVTIEEGCLSLPKFSANIERAENLTIEYQDINGETQITEMSGLLARTIQHEMDHLDGILIIDKSK